MLGRPKTNAERMATHKARFGNTNLPPRGTRLKNNNMPLPLPSKNEKRNEFISRCMSNETMKKEYPDQKQQLAICFSQFRKIKKTVNSKVVEKLKS